MDTSAAKTEKHPRSRLRSPPSPTTSGAKLLFGGKPLSSEDAKKIPAVYGAWEPTAVFVPLKEMLGSPENFALCTTEIFGPFQARGVFFFFLSFLPPDVRRSDGHTCCLAGLIVSAPREIA